MNLREMLPDFYANSPEMMVLQNAFAMEITAAQAARDDCFLQLDVNTATWGLDLWEEAYGIEKDASKSDEYRRTAILAKMRGAGVTTAAMIKNVAASFSGGEVEIIEKPGEYKFEVKFVGTMGIPPNMNDLTAAIEQIKPAHLAYGYIFFFRTNAQVAQYTHEQLAAYTHETIRGGELE